MNIHFFQAATDALIPSNPSSSMHLQNFSKPHSWVQSLYQCRGYTRRASTTSRPPVPPGLYSECRRDYLQDIDSKIKKYGIPPELVLNSDQTPSSYVSVGKSTMAQKGSTAILIKSVTDKHAITLNFGVTLANDYLPMQVIYSGKTKASQSRDFKFLSGFCVAQNPKHWSNEIESLKLIDEIISTYVAKMREELQLPTDQKALLVWDVFRGQMTDKVKERLDELNIECVYVPANMVTGSFVFFFFCFFFAGGAVTTAAVLVDPGLELSPFSLTCSATYHRPLTDLSSWTLSLSLSSTNFILYIWDPEM